MLLVWPGHPEGPKPPLVILAPPMIGIDFSSPHASARPVAMPREREIAPPATPGERKVVLLAVLGWEVIDSLSYLGPLSHPHTLSGFW